MATQCATRATVIGLEQVLVNRGRGRQPSVGTCACMHSNSHLLRHQCYCPILRLMLSGLLSVIEPCVQTHKTYPGVRHGQDGSKWKRDTVQAERARRRAVALRSPPSGGKGPGVGEYCILRCVLRTENVLVCYCCVGSDRVAGGGMSRVRPSV